MNEIIKKIDEEIEMYKNRISVRQGENYHDESERIMRFEERMNEAIRIKEIIQSEQIEDNRIESYTVKTKGDVIRESNESLAEFISKQYGYSQVKEGKHYLNLNWWLNQPIESGE